MDVPQLEREARELGTTKILVNVQNYSQAVFPAGLEDEILRLGFRDLDREWQKFDAYPERNREYDLGITLILSNVQVSPGAVSEKSFSEKKEIPDGFQYVLDENFYKKHLSIVMDKDSLRAEIENNMQIELNNNSVRFNQTIFRK